MEDFEPKVHLLSDVLKNNSISETTNQIINKYQLNNHTYNNGDDIINIVGELNLINEDIWKENTSLEQKQILEGEILFDIFKSLYDSITKEKRIKHY